ncbi:MAG: restriction endonuclease subunit S, partial [Luteibacter jiangsuensis]
MSSSMPSGWAKVTLGDVVEVRDFERDPVNAPERATRIKGKQPSELFPYYGATGQVGLIDAFRSQGEQVLLGEDGAPFLDPNRDKAYIVRGRYWVNNHAHVLRGIAGVMDNRLLTHQLNTVDFRSYVSGSTRLKLTSAAMRRIPLMLPPIQEQTR